MTDAAPRIRLVPARWPEDAPALRRVRRTVFVEEQGVDEALEWDGRDEAAEHVLALDETHGPVGTGRLEPDGKIGRMAVLPPWRGAGVGSRLLEALLERARARGLGHVHLHAQEHALAFYHRHGFLGEGPRFLEAGIPHVAMSRPSAESYRREIVDPASLRHALRLLAGAARRRFTLLARRAGRAAYADPELARALETLARRTPDLAVRLFVLEPDPSAPLPSGLRNLVHRLPSHAEARAPGGDGSDEDPPPQATADDRHLLLVVDEEEGRGTLRWNAPGETRRALGLFETLWEEGETPASFRRLDL